MTRSTHRDAGVSLVAVNTERGDVAYGAVETEDGRASCENVAPPEGTASYYTATANITASNLGTVCSECSACSVAV